MALFFIWKTTASAGQLQASKLTSKLLPTLIFTISIWIQNLVGEHVSNTHPAEKCHLCGEDFKFLSVMDRFDWRAIFLWDSRFDFHCLKIARCTLCTAQFQVLPLQPALPRDGAAAFSRWELYCGEGKGVERRKYIWNYDRPVKTAKPYCSRGLGALQRRHIFQKLQLNLYWTCQGHTAAVEEK